MIRTLREQPIDLTGLCVGTGFVIGCSWLRDGRVGVAQAA